MKEIDEKSTFCGDGEFGCDDLLVRITNNSLQIHRGETQVFSQSIFLKELVQEYSTKIVKLNPGEEKSFLDGDNSEFIFLFVRWESEQIEKPLMIKTSGYNDAEEDVDYLNSSWTPLYNLMSFTSIPGYPIKNFMLKNPNTDSKQVANIMIVNART